MLFFMAVFKNASTVFKQTSDRMPPDLCPLKRLPYPHAIPGRQARLNQSDPIMESDPMLLTASWHSLHSLGAVRGRAHFSLVSFLPWCCLSDPGQLQTVSVS